MNPSYINQNVLNIMPSVPRAWFKPAFFLGTGLLLCPSLTGADMLAIAVGRGNIFSQGSNAVFLSYQKDAPTLFNRKGSTVRPSAIGGGGITTLRSRSRVRFVGNFHRKLTSRARSVSAWLTGPRIIWALRDNSWHAWRSGANSGNTTCPSARPITRMVKPLYGSTGMDRIRERIS